MVLLNPSSCRPQWPPELPDDKLKALAEQAVLYALSHGLLFLEPSQTVRAEVPNLVRHAPFSLFPSLFPRRLFELAKRLQHVYNVLYARIATDRCFLDSVMGEETGVGRVDPFMGRLWRIWKDHRDEGIVQDLQLGIFRSDYLVHSDRGQSSSLKQVEFNTIAAAGGVHSNMTSDLHRYMHVSNQYLGASLPFDVEDLAVNETTAGLATALATAHKAYGVEQSRILFVVQPGELNIFDQRWIEYELLDRHGIHVVRQTFAELADSIDLTSPNRKLILLLHPNAKAIEISTVYFRSGYNPSDYIHPQSYDVRRLLERSRAIKCPSIPLQLAGAKKVQQVLTHPGVLERFLCDTDRWGSGHLFTSEQIDELRSSWMEMWSLDDDSVAHGNGQVNGYPRRTAEEEGAGIRRARACASSLVLKPQREGGGNNVYKSAILSFLDELTPAERPAWIAMALIVPPPDQKCYFVCPAVDADARLFKTEVAHELGIFGWTLFSDAKVIDEKEVGWLVRTKRTDSNEGGMSIGCSVLDSFILVDD